MVLVVDTNILLCSLSMLASVIESLCWTIIMDFQQILLNLVKQHRW